MPGKEALRTSSLLFGPKIALILLDKFNAKNRKKEHFLSPKKRTIFRFSNLKHK